MQREGTLYRNVDGVGRNNDIAHLPTCALLPHCDVPLGTKAWSTPEKKRKEIGPQQARGGSAAPHTKTHTFGNTVGSMLFVVVAEKQEKRNTVLNEQGRRSRIMCAGRKARFAWYGVATSTYNDKRSVRISFFPFSFYTSAEWRRSAWYSHGQSWPTSLY